LIAAISLSVIAKVYPTYEFLVVFAPFLALVATASVIRRLRHLRSRAARQRLLIVVLVIVSFVTLAVTLAESLRFIWGEVKNFNPIAT